MKRRSNTPHFHQLIKLLFTPKQLQVCAMVNEALTKQRKLTGSAYVIHKGEILRHEQYPKDHLSNPHSTLLSQFDDCVAQHRELNKLEHKVSEYLAYKMYKHPNDKLWKYIPASVHSWLGAEYKGKVSDDIPDWFTQLCAELLLLRMIYAND